MSDKLSIKITSRWVYPEQPHKCNFCSVVQIPGVKKKRCQKTRFIESSFMGKPFLSLFICKGCWNSTLKREAIVKEFKEVNLEQFKEHSDQFGIPKEKVLQEEESESVDKRSNKAPPRRLAPDDYKPDESEHI